MKILISNANNQPIYEQIYTQIRNQILSGELARPGLPLHPGPGQGFAGERHHHQAGLRGTGKGGYVYTVPAKGSYVAQQSTQLVREAYLTQIEEHIQEILSWPPPAAWGGGGVDLFRLL